MNPDDEVCLCFHVTLRKIRTYLKRENPTVASLISECLGAGTACMWCVPFLKHLHAEHAAGRLPDLRVSPEEYARTRLVFRATQARDPDLDQRAMGEDAPGAAPPDAG
ncbi:MAG: (2Fe-2S)-binding protein [Planctomycetota bacterium]|nr:(2Fe-2S)-binding protein [Planctomycetota bacterium]